MKIPAHIYALAVGIAMLTACTADRGTSQDETQPVDATLQEIARAIESEEWETARIKAENIYTSRRDSLSSIQAAKLTTLYISLTSEPDINFEQFNTYALRIVDLHDFALSSDAAVADNYFKLTGGETMVEEAYDNCKYIIEAKQKIGNDSTLELH